MSVSISVKTFFFGDHLILGKKSASIYDKPFESDSKSMKIRVKVAFSCLTLSKKPPPFFFQILATRLSESRYLIETNINYSSQKINELPHELHHMFVIIAYPQNIATQYSCCFNSRHLD